MRGSLVSKYGGRQSWTGGRYKSLHSTPAAETRLQRPATSLLDAPHRRENEERHMALSKTYLATAALAVALMTAAASSADAGWVRSGSGTGPRGNSWSSTGSGSCAGGTCSSSQTFTGPRGTTTRNGSTTCSGGTCNHTGTITGPNGGTINRSSTVTYR
jgi:hypothetical protein